MDNALAAERVQKQVGWLRCDARAAARAIPGRHLTIDTFDDTFMNPPGVGTLGHSRPAATYTSLSEIKK